MPDQQMTPEQFQAFVEDTTARLHNLETSPPLAYHTHTGYDMNKVRFGDIDEKVHYLVHTVPGVDAATAGYYSTFFIAPVPMVVYLFKEVHKTAGTDAGAVTLQLEKLTSTTAPGSGTNMLSTALSLKTTANTVQTGSLTKTLATINLATSDRLALKTSGTLTAVANVTVLIGLTF